MTREPRRGGRGARRNPQAARRGGNGEGWAKGVGTSLACRTCLNCSSKLHVCCDDVDDSDECEDADDADWRCPGAETARSPVLALLGVAPGGGRKAAAAAAAAAGCGNEKGSEKAAPPWPAPDVGVSPGAGCGALGGLHSSRSSDDRPLPLLLLLLLFWKRGRARRYRHCKLASRGLGVSLAFPPDS